MGQDLSLNVAVSNTAKEYALKKLPPDPALFSDKVKEPVAEGELRESALKWEKTEDSGGREEATLSSTDNVILTTVTAPSVVLASSGAADLREKLRDRFLSIYEQTYANVFSHNRLVAKVAEWMTGNALERLGVLGVSSQELSEVRGRVRENIISQNQSALAQVFYDETMLEIVA